MKIKVTVEVIESIPGNDYKEAQRLIVLATKGIVEKHVGRLRGLGINIYGMFGSGAQQSTVIEIDNEEEKVGE